MVYVPQNDIGRIRVGQRAEIRVDAFRNRTFNATVEQIRQKAEFLPRNVQTEDERQHQVFGVKLRVENPGRAARRRAGRRGLHGGEMNAAAVNPAIVARQLTRKFGDFVAVNQASLTVEPGEVFGFLGPNGSGKTTMIKMLTGILPITAGEAAVGGSTCARTRRPCAR